MRINAIYRAWLLAAAVAVTASSCSMMSEDRSDCPDCYNPLHVTLKYDYNMQRADMFNAHVGSAVCYVVDAQNKIVAKQYAANSATSQPLAHHSFAFNFEGLAEGDYRLFSIGAQRDQRQMDDDTFHATDLAEGDVITDLQLLVPYADAADAEGRHAVCAEAPLDTLWHGMTVKPVHVARYEAAFDTISLVRDTKNLSITLLQTDDPADIAADRYEVRLTDANSRLGYDNASVSDVPLLYTPYAEWTTEALDAAQQVAQRTAHYELSFGRLLDHADDATKNARLQIYSKEEQKTVVDIDLVYYLAMARSAAGTRYGVQEFLDREYDYRLDIVLEGNQWRYMTLSISLMNWTLRIQNQTL